MKGPIVKKRYSFDSKKRKENNVDGFFLCFSNLILRVWTFLFEKKSSADKRKCQIEYSCLQEDKRRETDNETKMPSSLSSSFIELRNGKIIFKN